MDWDLSPYFDGVDDAAFADFFTALQADVTGLTAELADTAELSSDNVDRWRDALDRYEAVATRHSHLMSFLYCMRAYDVTDDAVQREAARASMLGASMTKLLGEFRRALRDATDGDVSALVAGDLEPLAFFVERLQREARRSMDTHRESLAADLGTDGIGAWGRLYDTVAGKLELDVAFPDGRRESVPMAQRRSLLGDKDRRVRRAAFVAGNAAWESVSDTMAAAINHIAGTRLGSASPPVSGVRKIPSHDAK